jgi:hypothetical protein
VLGSGLLLSAVTVLVPVVLGGAPLENAAVEGDLPLLGHLKVTSALPFDIGVYLVVLGLVLMVFESFGDDLLEVADDAPAAPGGVRETPGVTQAAEAAEAAGGVPGAGVPVP